MGNSRAVTWSARIRRGGDIHAALPPPLWGARESGWWLSFLIEARTNQQRSLTNAATIKLSRITQQLFTMLSGRR
ncbi:MAG: hypothetical protein KFF50_08635 [Desulfatitalea sp.]|nr:hypothetical protein [Desulfatitalea sp.]